MLTGRKIFGADAGNRTRVTALPKLGSPTELHRLEVSAGVEPASRRYECRASPAMLTDLERIIGLKPMYADWQPAVLAAGRNPQELGAECENRTHVWSLEDSGPATGRIPLGSGVGN